MNQKEIKDLIDYLVEKDIAEFELERGDMKVRVKRGAAVVSPVVAPVAAPAAQVSAGLAPGAAGTSSMEEHQSSVPAEEVNLHVVRSPIVGSYYESPSPGAPAFVKVGDQVHAGQVLCIVEAMKLMNEIESDIAGEILRILVANGQPVEYGQPLYEIRVK